MIDSKRILDFVNPIDYKGNMGQIDAMVSIDSDHIVAANIFWCGDKNMTKLQSLETGNVLVSTSTFEYARNNCDSFESINWIVVSNPRGAFSKILKEFFEEKQIWGSVGEYTSIELSVVFDKKACNIGSSVVVEKNCILGRNVVIGHGSIIKAGSVIGDGVKIGCNNVIGGVGFGYEMDENGEYQVIPHIGNVVLKNNVEIGNNVCIDRAVMGSTILHENVKVDNLVHIAHGVEIGKNSLIIANAMVAGSVHIGENVWVSPSSSIIQKVTIGDNSLVGLGSTVLKDVEKSSIVVGSPAKKLKDR